MKSLKNQQLIIQILDLFFLVTLTTILSHKNRTYVFFTNQYQTQQKWIPTSIEQNFTRRYTKKKLEKFETFLQIFLYLKIL